MSQVETAGPEMDRLVAVRVMLWRAGMPGSDGGLWTDGNGKEVLCHGEPLYDHGDGRFSPSSKVEHAWLVVERLGRMGHTIDLQYKGEGRQFPLTVEVSVTSANLITVGLGVGTMPLATCLAALMAVAEGQNRERNPR